MLYVYYIVMSQSSIIEPVLVAESDVCPTGDVVGSISTGFSKILSWD